MPLTQNKTFIYKQVPQGVPVAGQDLTVEDRPIDLDQELPPNGLLLQVHDASFDPYLRGKMRDPSVKSYAPAFLPDQPIVNTCLAKVHRSNNDEYKEGDLVLSFLPIAEYAVVQDPKQHMTRKVNNPHNLELGVFLGALGMPGLTAWSSLYKIGKPKKGETIFISSAAGAVGQVVGQVAKKEGLRVIGSVGSDEKLEFIKSLGYDDGFNYKKESPKDALPRLCPDGIDIYFENVGGEHLEAAIDNMNRFGRIPVCGMINDYNTPQDKRVGPKNLFKIVASQLTLEGFLVGNPGFGPVYFQEHQEKLGAWIADGSVKTKLDITEGIDNASQGLIDQLEGKNFGKAVLRIR